MLPISSSNRALVSPQSKQIFRIKDDCWAQLASARQPDPLLLSRTSHTEKLSKSKERYFTLENKAQAESLSFARSVGEAAAHSLRLESAAAATSQHAITSIQGMLADPDLPTKFKDQLVSIQSAAQLSLTATAESVDIQSRVRGAAAFRERDIWLDTSRFSAEVIKEAKNLPMPAGSLDSEGSLVKPSMLGDKFSKLLTDKYKTLKYADKVAPEFKRPLPPSSSRPFKRFKA